MASADLETKERLHRLVDELDGADLARAEAALRQLRRAHESSARPRRQSTLQRALGIAATHQSPPTDEEVERWLEEERLKKYGS